jgi:hypothetical protein
MDTSRVDGVMGRRGRTWSCLFVAPHISNCFLSSFFLVVHHRLRIV